MAEVGVDGAADDLAANTAKLLCSVAESDDLSWAHKGEVQGVEEENQILPWNIESGKKGHNLFKYKKYIKMKEEILDLSQTVAKRNKQIPL